MKFGYSLKQTLLYCVFLFALIGQAQADMKKEAINAYQMEHYKRAAILFEPLAEKGDVGSQLALGILYGSGQLPRNFIASRKWLHLAATQGSSAAQLALGDMFLTGIGAQEDYNQAMHWFQFAAEKGEPLSMLKLGIMYADGLGVLRDQIRAYMWFNVGLTISYNINKENMLHILSDEEITEKLTGARNDIKREMTPAQINEAQMLSNECLANYFKNC